MKQSIGDFAMNLINEQTSGKKTNFDTKPVIPGASGPDLSKVKLPDNAMDLILEQSFGLKVEKKAKPVQEAKAPAPVEKTKTRTPDQIVAEFTEIVVKARALLQEMTTCGLLGTSQTPKKKIKAQKATFKYRKNV